MEIQAEEREFKCAVCGEQSVHTVMVAKGAEQNAPDLDMRPAEPLRSCLEHWVSKCPSCGYCNTTIDIPANFTREYLDSDNYNKSGDDLAGRFMKKALVCEKNKDWTEALKSCMYAAWACDDDDDDVRAVEYRKAAVKVYDTHLSYFSESPDVRLLIADLVRRSGDCDRVVRDYKGKRFGSPLVAALTEFEVELAEKGDIDCHRADEAPNVRAK